MPKTQLEEGQILLCTVTKIVGTIVFVKIEEYDCEGTITFAEIFPGKIRNIRDFVFPGKKIVCKVLRISSQVIELSLRRVKVNERNEFNELYKKEKSYFALLRTILGEAESKKAIEKIKNENNLVDLLDKSKENPELLNKYLSKEFSEKILSILKEKKSKDTLITKKIALESKLPNGVLIVKKIIKEASEGLFKEELSISYIAAGKYLIKIKTKDPRISDQNLRKFLENLEALAKKNSCEFKELKD